MNLEDELQRYFGFREFRPLQKKIIASIIAGNDCLAILPTGGGKSLCFQLPGLILGGTTLVISPLISLMTDQVAHLQKRGVRAVALTSSLSAQEKDDAMNSLRKGEVQFLYLSPEKLHSTAFQKELSLLDVQLVVIDEAHCISEWGHQFRPEYRLIFDSLHLLKKRPIIAAFTASATPSTATDILKQLHLSSPTYYRQSILRSNLSLHVLPCPTSTVQHFVVTRLLRKHDDEFVIIYCATRRQTEETADHLRRVEKSAVAYHAGLESQLRKTIQSDFLEGKIKIICATTAFGMGVDKPDIRCVIHLNLPASLEGYYQEVGRAGRDGAISFCYLLLLPEDTQLQTEILESSFPPLQVTRAVIDFLRVRKMRKNQLISIKEVAHIIIEQGLQTRLRLSLERGANCSWWSVEGKNIRLLLEPRDIHQKWLLLTERQIYQLKKLKKMSTYSTEKHCRMKQLLYYFEPVNQLLQFNHFRCGNCDICKPAALAKPTPSEKKLYTNLQRVSQISHYKRKTKPRLTTICYQAIAVQQPLRVAELDAIAGIGRGWRKEWSPMIEELLKITASRTDTADHQQIRAADSTREFPLPK